MYWSIKCRGVQQRSHARMTLLGPQPTVADRFREPFLSFPVIHAVINTMQWLKHPTAAPQVESISLCHDSDLMHCHQTSSSCLVIDAHSYNCSPHHLVLHCHLHACLCFSLFLRKLKLTLKIPVLALVDSDPYGLKILSVYMKGSMNMSYDSSNLTTPDIKWLGVRPSDLDRCVDEKGL